MTALGAHPGVGRQVGVALSAARDGGTGRLHLELGDQSWTVAAMSGNAHTISGEDVPATLRVVDADLTSRFGTDAARLIDAFSRREALKIRFVAAEEEELGPLGPALPLLPILSEASTHGRNESDLWHTLGGRRGRLRMVSAPELSESQLAEVAESFHALLARLLQPRPVEDIVNEDDDPEGVLARLVQLQSLGLLRQVGADDPEASTSLSRSSLDLFLERVHRDLERGPVEGSPESHRHRVADLLRNFGVWNAYELLGVDRHDDEATIHRGYVEVAKSAHPDNAARLGLEGHDAALVTIFEVATQAYLTLSNPDRRRDYDRDLGPVVDEPQSEQRRLEKASVARDMYQRSRRMAMEEEFQPVLELMQQAVQLDPQAEYYALLGKVQLRNPEWAAGAVASYRDAVRCTPDDADLRLQFAQALEETGDKEQAGIQYRAAVELKPELEEAQEQMESFEDREPEEKSPVLRAFKALMGRGK